MNQDADDLTGANHDPTADNAEEEVLEEASTAEKY